MAETDMDIFLKEMADTFPELGNIEEIKFSSTDEPPFYRIRIRVKPEIVTLGHPEINPSTIKKGTYVEPKDWNDIISDPDVIVIDTRNHYEVEIGTFHRAIDPNTQIFREFPQYIEENLDPKKNKKVAMYCTGGVRCEKASAYMLDKGFEEVYHLKGGILKYLEEIPIEKSLWIGECFVFDQRTAVGNGLEYGKYSFCRCCRHPITEDDKKIIEEEGEEKVYHVLIVLIH